MIMCFDFNEQHQIILIKIEFKLIFPIVLITHSILTQQILSKVNQYFSDNSIYVQGFKKKNEINRSGRHK